MTLWPAVVTFGLLWLAMPRWQIVKSPPELGLQQLPDALDLLALGVASGLDVAGSLDLVHRYGPREVSRLVAPVISAIASGRPVVAALEASGINRSDPLGIVFSALGQAHGEGVAVEDRLERLSADFRRIARSREQVTARKLSVRLLVPLTVCMLPAFALLTVVPVLNEALG